MTRTGSGQRTHGLALCAAPLLLFGCSGAEQGVPDPTPPTGVREGISPAVRESDKLAVVDPAVDYGLALRTAAIKLTGNYPTLAEIKELAAATDQAATYAARLDDYLGRNTFATEQIAFWRDTFKLGGQVTLTVNGTATTINMETAPTFAAMVVFQDRPFTDVLTASSGTCASYDMNAHKFNSADCTNGTTAAGVLTDPGVLAQFYSSMAFRRTRWVQEIFMCSAFPAETGRMEQHPGGVYASPWPFNSIAGGSMARVDFHSDTSLICANCHSSINHIAPLLGKFDEAGKATADFSVHTPVPGTPFTALADWLPAGETTAWRYGKPVTDVKSLGAAVAADPGMPSCVASRIWNWALSRGDIVIDQATVPSDMSVQLGQDFVASGYNVKKTIRAALTSASFVRF